MWAFQISHKSFLVIFIVKQANETVEKHLARKISEEISHWGLENGVKNRQNVVLTTKIWRFLMLSAHFSKIILKKGLFRQSQRQALAASAGFGRKKSKVEPAFGTGSAEVRATPALVRCTRSRWRAIMFPERTR
jgi:hypothetical protein